MSLYIEVYKNRYLLFNSIKNEVKAKYAGHLLGGWWLALSPLLLLSIYSVVYIYIFKLRPLNMSPMQYILYIFSGLIPFLSIAESLNLSTNSITSNVSILKNIMFPVSIVPVKAVITAHISLAISLLFILVMDLFLSELSVHLLLLPIIILLQIFFLIGISYFLSLLNVIIKDTANFITYLIMVIMISSPIAYSAEMVPERFKIILKLNPFAYFFELYQSVIALNQFPSIKTLSITILFSLLTLVAGERFFIKARKVILNYV